MDNTPMTFTSLALFVLLVIMCIMFACHCLGTRASKWMHSNKEEKIGLSNNKLFHANGYMLKQIHSGSEFLLSTSGSFKRFDTIDKDDHNKSAAADEQPHHTTTPLWNLPQADVNIPPQPLRPAPAPVPVPGSAGSTKTVTFAFNQIDELDSPSHDAPTAMDGVGAAMPPAVASSERQHGQAPDPGMPAQYPRSCLRSPLKTTTVPHAIEAPPPPRLTNSTSVTLSASAIPRPLAKRQVSLQNGINRDISSVNGHAAAAAVEPPATRRHPTLTRRNSSTNPFLCESVESLGSAAPQATSAALMHNEGRAMAPSSAAPQRKALTDDNSNSNHNNNNSKSSSNNPFHTTGTCGTSGMPSTDTDYRRPMAAPRNRSLSTTEVDDAGGSETSELRQLSSRLQATATAGLLRMHNTTNPFSGLTQRVKGPHLLQKTISEDFLFRKLGVNGGHAATGRADTGTGTWSFGRSLLRQDSNGSLGRRNSSQCSLDSSLGSMDGINLEHAVSCESVHSDSSLFQCELDQPYTQITGYLCVGLQYDRNNITSEGMELTVSVLEAKGLICPFSVESLDTFVRIYLVPDQAGAMQTKVFQSSQTPSYNESFNFWLRKQQGRHSLWFHLYHNGLAHTLIGEAEMEIGEMPRPITTWIPLSDSRKCNARWGELMFSLSYLPTAERLTIVIVKARNLKLELGADEAAAGSAGQPQHVSNVFVKVYLMNNDKKVLKKRTSLKRKDRCPIFNESMIFSVPPHGLTTVQLRLTVFGVVDNAIVPLGHVIAGSCAVGKGLRHWHQMLSSLRKPVAMWHVLRRATNQPIFTGGAEAVVAAMQNTAALQRAKRNSII